MDEHNNQPGQPSHGESTASGGTGTAARMKEQISETTADVKDGSVISAAKPPTRSIVRVNQLPLLWRRQLLRYIRAVTNCPAWLTPLLTRFRRRQIMFAEPI
jgi:hypothetical protein